MAERIVEVEWEDSSLTHSWTQKEALPDDEAIECRSVGYLESDNERGIRLLFQLGLGHDGEIEQFCCSTFIPRSAIRKVTELARKR